MKTKVSAKIAGLISMTVFLFTLGCSPSYQPPSPPPPAAGATPGSSSPALLTQLPPTLDIIAPAAGSIVPAGIVTVSVAVTNLTLVPPALANVPGQGHLHYYLDVAIPTTPGVPAVTAVGTYQATPGTTATWAGVLPGLHTFGVQLVNNDHTPLVPPVTATATVTVQ